MKRYRDNTRAMKCNREQRAMMDKIQSLSFAMVETALYLDGHPHNRMALAYYTKLKNQLECVKNEYEMKYAPITYMGNGGNEQTGWQWVKQPWPWEVNFPEMGDNPDVNGDPNCNTPCGDKGKED